VTKRQRVEAVYALQRADRNPFVPAIYEHKGALIGKSPSEICRNGELLYAGLLRELEVYDADMLVIGIDVYNVEAEALGCRIRERAVEILGEFGRHPGLMLGCGVLVHDGAPEHVHVIRSVLDEWAAAN
jgi:uroporphyrinogen-III decarboxylase